MKLRVCDAVLPFDYPARRRTAWRGDAWLGSAGHGKGRGSRETESLFVCASHGAES